MRPLATDEITLTTPSLGVRQWRDDGSNGTTNVAWATTGGRGTPSTVIVMPVIEVNTAAGRRWRPPDGLLQELRFDPARFWAERSLRYPMSNITLVEGGDRMRSGAVRVMPVDDRCGEEWEADHIVLLLVFEESPRVGEPVDGQGATLEVPPRHENKYCDEIGWIGRFFDENYDARLVARGLVRLRPPGGDKNAGAFVFALASCQYPADITDGAPNDHRGPESPPTASLLRLSRLITPRTADSPSLLVLAGDQVYVDATAGICDPRSKDDRFRLPYENLLASPGIQAVGGLLPIAMVLDDHELVDNWEPGIATPPDDAEALDIAERRRLRVVFPDPNIDNGKLAYRRFQRMAGPDCAKDRLWCFFRHAGVPFFLADTRTERGVPRPGDGRPDPRRVDNWRRARIMKDGQRDALRAFLRADEHRGRVRFVVSPAMLFPRGFGLDVEESLALERDGWDGFPASMNELLAFLCDEDLERVVFLSGDAHTSLVARAVITHANHRVTVWSVHSSGLYCPYPFINDTADFYPDHEDYTFASPQNPNPDYRAVVDLVRAVPGDGFATLKLVDLAKGHQALRLHFHRDDCVKDLDIQF